LVNAGVNFVG